MERRILGRSGIEVGIVGLGTWALGGGFWGEQDDREAVATIRRCLDLGINLLDTADVYGEGRSEEIVGKAVQGERSKVVIATKIGWKGYDESTGQSAYTSSEKVVSGVEESLARLRTDYADIVFCHLDYRDRTMESFLEGFRQLKRDGKIRAYGVSTADIAYLREFDGSGDCGIVQVDYSILHRLPEQDVLPYCQDQGIGVMVRGPLAMGRLTGKLSPRQRFPVGDWRNRWFDNAPEREIFLSDLKVVEGLRPLSSKRTLVQAALQFVLHNPAVTAVIPGARTPAQVEENAQAACVPGLTRDELDHIDRLVPPGGGRKIWPA